MKRLWIVTVVWGLAACGGDGKGSAGSDAGVPPRIVELVVDANRDGVLDPEADRTGKAAFTASSGAIMLANVDDDDGDHKVDAEDEIVNGQDDLDDLARIQVRAWPTAPLGTTGRVTLDSAGKAHARLFRLAPSGLASDATVVPLAGLALTAGDLAAGVELGIEAKDFPQPGFAGDVGVSLSVSDAKGAPLGTDTVSLRVAPFLLPSNVDPAVEVQVSNLGDADSLSFQAGVAAGVAAGGSSLRKIDANRSEYLDQYGDPDQWTQDFYETGYTLMPGRGGPHIMNVVMRAATEPRPAADFTFIEMLGKDYGYIHPRASGDPPTHDVSMDSDGDLDAIPPYQNGPDKQYPLGRVLIGESADRQPDQTVFQFFQSQKPQTVFTIDTSWLLVGHVDEVVSFAPTPGSGRGWKLLLASPRQARKLLTDAVSADPANADAELFTGKTWIDFQTNAETPAATAIKSILSDVDLMAASQAAQVQIDGIRAALAAEIGLSDDDIVEVPVLFKGEPSTDLSGNMVTQYVAYSPGLVNQLVVGTHVIAPDPVGPEVGGMDLFQADEHTRLGALGMTVHFADAWNLYHRLDGEVHCGTNVTRQVPTVSKWWEMGK